MTQDTDRETAQRPYGDGFRSLHDLTEMAQRAEDLEELAPWMIQLLDHLLMIRDKPLRIGKGFGVSRVFAHNVEIVHEPCEGVKAWLNISFEGTFGANAHAALASALHLLGIQLLLTVNLIRCGDRTNDGLVPVLFPRENWPNLREHSTV